MNHDTKFVITTLKFVGVSGNSVSIDFPPLISEIVSVNGSHFKNSTISVFFSRNFGKTFPYHVFPGAVHSTKNIRLPFCRNFQWRTEQHFPEFQESSSRNFLIFRSNVSHFKNSTISGFSGHFRKKFTDQISSFLNFRNFHLNGQGLFQPKF